MHELRNTKNNANATKLVQAIESEKLGASRAVLQNQQLKKQLSEMENAFITLVSKHSTVFPLILTINTLSKYNL